MSVLRAEMLTPHDLPLVGWETKRAYERDQRDIHRWQGLRATIGYQCIIPCTVQNPMIRDAIEDVLSRIADIWFNDALVLQSRVHSIDAMPGRERYFRNRQGKDRVRLGRWRGLDAKILLNEKDIMNYDEARYVFAHECGHAAQRIGHDWGYRANERWADKYAADLGFVRPASIRR